MIVKICRKCGGSGNKLVSPKPIRFKPCNKCGGKGGRCAPGVEVVAWAAGFGAAAALAVGEAKL